MLDGIADRTREGCAARGPAAPLGVFRSLTLPFTVGGHSSGLPGVKLFIRLSPRRGCRPILRMPVPALRIPKQQHTTRAPGLSAPDHEDDLSFPATRCSCPTAVSHGLLHGSGAAASPRVSGLHSQQTALRRPPHPRPRGRPGRGPLPIAGIAAPAGIPSMLSATKETIFFPLHGRRLHKTSSFFPNVVAGNKFFIRSSWVKALHEELFDKKTSLCAPCDPLPGFRP